MTSESRAKRLGPVARHALDNRLTGPVESVIVGVGQSLFDKGGGNIGRRGLQGGLQYRLPKCNTARQELYLHSSQVRTHGRPNGKVCGVALHLKPLADRGFMVCDLAFKARYDNR